MNNLQDSLFTDMTETADNMPKCEVCGMFATTEWKKYDDGAHYTYRCDDHQENEDFNPAAL